MGREHILLETDRFRLRKFQRADAADLFALDNDAEVMRYINGGIETPRKMIELQVMPLFLEYDDSRRGLGFWALETIQGSFLGWVCLRPVPLKENEASLGYRLCRNAWGEGYATEASRSLLALGFRTLGLARVWATTYEDNLASRRVLAKLGFRLTRRFKMDVAGSDTANFESAPVFEGDDLEFVLDRRTDK